MNYWMIPRPKRKLLPVVDVLSTYSLITLNQLWQGETGSQLDFEAELERAGLKGPGPRRDQSGSGARTYESWLHSLGLVFTDSSSMQRLTLAGEALIDGQPPVPIITDQLMKFQYPSAYSVRRGVRIDSRFKVHPFRFILALLRDPRITTLTKGELARFVITLGDRDEKVDLVAEEILKYRTYGEAVLPADFNLRYPARGEAVQSTAQTLSRLEDVANTFINFIEYTQLVIRDTPSSPIYIEDSQVPTVDAILGRDPGFVPHPDDQEFFQRRYGLTRDRSKDTRTFKGTSVSHKMIASRLVMNEFLRLSGERPIMQLNAAVIDEVSRRTGVHSDLVEDALTGKVSGALGAFEASYLDMARSGREEATEFELATQQIFGPEGFGFTARHVGPRPRQPDLHLLAEAEGYGGIIDAKAYTSYSISNDHRNRMLVNYIPPYQNHQEGGAAYPLAFWGYVAGGLKPTVSASLAEMSAEVGIPGFAITAQNLIKLLDRHRTEPLRAGALRTLFAAGGIIRAHAL